MLRRLMIVLIAFVLIVATSPLPPPLFAFAQDGSPVPADALPTLPATDSDAESVSPADFDGNTPPGQYTAIPLFPRSDVYIYIFIITVGGQTDVIDGPGGNPPFAVSGYRSDNAKVITIQSTAVHEGNLNVCVMFDGSAFANPTEIDLFVFDGAAWTVITNSLDTTTVCGYSAVFGSFAVAEAGIAPSSTPTTSSTSSPTATNTFTPAPTETPPPTETSTATHSPSETPTDTASATSTNTATPTNSPSPTSSPTATETSVASATSTATFTPSSTATATIAPTETNTATATSTPSDTSTSTPSETGTPSPTSTSAPSPIQFALPNVYVTYLQIPTAGDTEGEVISGAGLPTLSSAYRSENAWFFWVGSTVVQSGNKKLCVMFETATYSDPHRLVLLQSNGSSWTTVPNQVLDSLSSDQGTLCGYVSSFGDFALVERAPSTATATFTPSRTPTSTATATPTRTPIPSATSTGTATSSPTETSTSSPTYTPSITPTSSATPTSSVTSTSTASSTPTTSNTPTATLAPGSHYPGTTLRVTTGVNLRSGASTSFPSRGVLPTGSIVTATGSSIAAGGYSWVPVTSSLGAGWIAGSYLAVVPTATPTRTPAPPTVTRTPAGSTPSRTPSRTPTRPPGGFVAGDAVRTTTNVNLRSGPNTSSTVLRVVPSNTTAAITGPGIVSGGNTFYPVTISGYPSGYLAGAYLQRIGATATPSRTGTATATVVGNTVRYTTANVNLRTGPGTGYRIVATIPEGTRVNITGAVRRVSGTDWYPIIVNGVGSGWMSGAYLTLLLPI